MDNSVLLFFLGQLVTAAAIWGGIRVDIRNIYKRIDDLSLITSDAHKRLDRHIEHQLASRANSD